ncbi:DUF3558 domain-containing protein (plasmid) [Amycolatopsis sp. AA4]|nr:DUF3558 domain-containing protein [Amycolatopsis sp. AA4]
MAVAATLLAGCSGLAPSLPAASSSPAPAQADTPPGPAVPKIQHPLDISRFIHNPCSALTSAQIAELLGDGTRTLPDPHGAGGPGCAWFEHTAEGPHAPLPASVILLVPDVDKLGLASIYAAKGGAYAFVDPMTPIDGYPVVAYGVEARASKPECNVALGTSDTQTLDVGIRQSARNSRKRDPCDAARQVMETVYRNLRS